ncbi:aminoacyl-tRNA hydrolase [Patescibacteria group bacterium]|nr:aminoacyl-tRNA hydrolase [Patescibacteria group bacterium]
MKLIVGLGNPGEKYAQVRHNLGFRVVDELAESVKGQGESWKKEDKFKSEILNFTLNASPLTLVKPQTYMNNSGMAVRQLADYFKIATEDIIIIHDEMDLPLGKIKVRLGGAAAGHHGVESIIKTLGTDQFIRVRLGVEPLEGFIRQPEKFVLEQFIPKEKPKVKHMIKQAVKALEILLEKGLDSAQNQYN